MHVEEAGSAHNTSQGSALPAGKGDHRDLGLQSLLKVLHPSMNKNVIGVLGIKMYLIFINIVTFREVPLYNCAIYLLRCLLMVLLAVNLTIWIITVIEESRLHTNELQEYLYKNHSQEHLYRNHSETNSQGFNFNILILSIF